MRLFHPLLRLNRLPLTASYTRTMHRVSIPDKMEIHLTEVEDRICTLLDRCTKQMKAEQGLDTSCRIAGGWVRDKVNIDIS